MRHNRALLPTMVHRIPVNLLEPGMFLDRARAALHIPEPFSHIDVAEPADEVARIGGHGAGIAHFALDNLLVDFDRVLVPEGRLADEEFVDEDAKGPPVDCGAVSGVADDFRSEVFGRAA